MGECISQMALRTNWNSKKEEVIRTVRSCLDESKTHNEFLELLRDAGLPHYERKGIPQGIVFENIKFRFSRLSISFTDLQVDVIQEESTLDEIQKLRELQRVKDANIELTR